ncbi:response regulator transcription factor [Paenibacillus eucommiae]|uniref:YesN/AraC family two-component response regulator n=1 Tax=Paenibacillus eucommiae TaxID=1355755 RepID=A0ABS4J081_9BACL|nr:response regulator [Paenibacillus eucommiae]MBP1993244.1 YesN/AraC family two-component response regulator [Paenibacillus eucommiae]
MLRILIADDEPIERKVLNKIVVDSQLPAVVVDMARSGNEALEQFERYLPDLIFMDIRMPGLNGLDVSAAIKSRMSDTAIAIVTAFDEFQYAKRAIDLHIDYFVLKPVDAVEVERIIRNVLASKPEVLKSVGVPQSKVSINRAQLARQILDELHQHYAEPIQLDWLEKKLNISRQYLSRTFKDTYQITIMNYLSQFRIKLAIKLLPDPNLTIAAVAEKVGIADVSYFGQLFKQTHGVTPTQYRMGSSEPDVFPDEDSP